MTTPVTDIVRTFYRAFSGDTDLLDQVLADDWDDIPLNPGQAAGRAGAKQLIAGVGSVFRDFQIVVHDLVDGRGPDGNGLVAARAELRGVQEGDWFGVPGTGQPFSVRIHEFHQVAGDRIVRTWHLEDWHGWLQHAALQAGADTATPATMRALRIDGYGKTPELAQVPTPSPGPDQVLVKVAGAALNPLDVKLVAGYLQDFFPVGSFPYTVGTDLSGTVAAVGPDVTAWAVGDAVVGRTDPPAGGAVAEFAVVPAEQLAAAPSSLPWLSPPESARPGPLRGRPCTRWRTCSPARRSSCTREPAESGASPSRWPPEPAHASSRRRPPPAPAPPGAWARTR